MKRFDQQSIKNRSRARIRLNQEWAMVVEDATTDVVLGELAEQNAEIARYLEYMLREKKWKSAVNKSSLTHLGALLSRKPERPKSAVGYVIVAATDPKGVDRLANFGRYFFNLDTLSNWDNLEERTDLPLIYQKSLTPWMHSESFTIPKNTVITSSSGIPFLTTQAVSSRSLTKPYSEITATQEGIDFFKSLGGWNGIKYLKVPVIQGKIKTVEFGPADNSKFETFKIDSAKVENASNSVSKEYLKFIVTNSAGEAEEWVQVRNIFLAGPYDKFFEVYTSDDGSSTLFKVGNGITGAMIPENCQVKVQYLETEGSGGNIEAKYQITNISFPAGFKMIDPRTNAVSDFLKVTNISKIGGGRDAESNEDYREDAPKTYLENNSLGNLATFKKFLSKNSPIPLSKFRVFKSSIQEEQQVEDKTQLDFVMDKFLKVSSAIGISGLDADGKVLEDPQTFIDTLTLSLTDIKAPSDILKYVAPNKIDFKVSIDETSKDSSLSETEIKSLIKALVNQKYHWSKTDFNKDFQKNEIVKLIKLMEFTEKTEVKIAAKAKIQTSAVDLKVYTTSQNTDLLAIPFRFDKIFGLDSSRAGFKNYLQQQNFLLRCDFKNINVATPRSFTAFLLDNRYKTSEGTKAEVEEAKMLYTNIKPLEEDYVETAFGKTTLFNETQESFQDRLVRVSQHPFIKENITDNYWKTLKTFDSTVAEVRPYVVDGEGKNKEFDYSDVGSNLAVNIPNSTKVYKRNTKYIPKFDILFQENYQFPEESNYASGCILIPLSALSFSSSLQGLNDSEKLGVLSQLLPSFYDISVTAEPLMDNILPNEENDFLSIASIDDIDVSVKYV